jgi:hypothetical protein
MTNTERMIKELHNCIIARKGVWVVVQPSSYYDDNINGGFFVHDKSFCIKKTVKEGYGLNQYFWTAASGYTISCSYCGIKMRKSTKEWFSKIAKLICSQYALNKANSSL